MQVTERKVHASRCQRPGAPGSHTSRVEGQEGTWSDRWSLAITTCVGRLKPPALESGLLRGGGTQGLSVPVRTMPPEQTGKLEHRGGLHGVG